MSNVIASGISAKLSDEQKRSVRENVGLGNVGNKNLIINGDMQVSQRGTSIPFGEAYTLDRWRIVGGTSPVRVASRENNTTYSTVPHSYYMKITNNGQDMYTTQRVENARQFSGKTVTISYWVWSTTGSYTATSGSWGNLQSANGNHYNVSGWGGASVNVTTTPQYVTHTIDFADVSSYSHTEGDFFEWSIYHNTSNDLYLTGVQLELGSVATPFEHRSYGEELALCQRYFQVVNISWQGYCIGNNQPLGYSMLPTLMRSTPSFVKISDSYVNMNYGVGVTPSADHVKFYPTATASTMSLANVHGTLDAEL